MQMWAPLGGEFFTWVTASTRPAACAPLTGMRHTGRKGMSRIGAL